MAFDTSDPKVQKALLVTLLVAGALYAYFTYVFQPAREDLTNLESEVRRMESDLGAARAIVQASDTVRLRQELEKRGLELELAEQLLPREENLPDLLKEITLEAERHELKLSLFKPNAPVQLELYQVRSYQVRLRGGFHQTAAFLANVADLPQIVKPAALQLVRDTRLGKENDETVDSELVLMTYLMIPAPKGQVAQEKK